MSFLGKIFGAAGTAAVGTVAGTVESVANVVERWKPSDKAKHEMAVEDAKIEDAGVAAARAYDPRSGGESLYAQIINTTVDGLNRLIRPGVTIVVFGGLFGWWPLQVTNIDPFVVSLAQAIALFWFGARTVTKDIPAMVKALRK